MKHSPLITASELAALLQAGGRKVLVCDCTFDLADPGAGARSFADAHIPGAVYVHLDHVLSTEKTGSNGRHPLPARDTFAAAMAALGADIDTRIVAYDANGSMFAARLWWMLRWAGHADVAVLDGGLQAWTADAGNVAGGPALPRKPGNFRARPALVETVDYSRVLENLATAELLVVDARSPDRFRGENETIDPVGGHIPNARNRFFKDNLTASGRFKPAAELRSDFERLFADVPAHRVVNQCGSGVTACHNLLAMEVAGLEGAALYPGSWSEWCARPDAPVSREA